MINEILDCIRYYEKQNINVEADCRNLESSYTQNDNTAQGFLVAIRKQEHWNGANFESIAKELLRINPSKICKYIIMRSIDCPIEIIEQEFNPAMYTWYELETIAQNANSNIILRKIQQYIKTQIGYIEGYNILRRIVANPITEGDILDELHKNISEIDCQIIKNCNCNASTELLMEIFFSANNTEKRCYINYLLQFQRVELNESIVKWDSVTPGILSKILTYSYKHNTLSEEIFNLAEEKMLKMNNYAGVLASDLMNIAQYGHNTALRKKCQQYLKK